MLGDNCIKVHPIYMAIKVNFQDVWRVGRCVIKVKLINGQCILRKVLGIIMVRIRMMTMIMMMMMMMMTMKTMIFMMKMMMMIIVMTLMMMPMMAMAIFMIFHRGIFIIKPRRNNKRNWSIVNYIPSKS